MVPPDVREAAARHLEEVAADILQLLGPGIELDRVVMEPERPDGVALRADYRMAGISRESLGRGANVVEAHARLREAIVEDRIGLALEVLAAPRRRGGPRAVRR